MDRRTFLAASAATLSVAAVPAVAQNLVYSPGLVEQRLAAGDTVFLDFKAQWCTTCRAQERAISRIKGENPEYDQRITFIEVDWDEHGSGQLARTLRIPRRSTLVVLKGNQELGRLVAQTRPAQIRQLMNLALQAAS